MFLPANLNLERKGQCEILYSFLHQAPQIEMEELSLVRILTLCQLLPVFPGSICRFWSKWGVQTGLILVTRNCRGRKITFPLLFKMSSCLRLLFPKTPHTWISLFRLKVLQCDCCNSRLALVSLTCLFSLKTKFNSLEASHWTQSSLSWPVQSWTLSGFPVWSWIQSSF